MKIVVGNGACVHAKAQLGDGVTVAAGAVIGEHVVIGPRTKIGTGAIIDGWTTLGADCDIHPYVVIGGPPQHTVYKGERSYVEIGDRNILREFVTIHRATGEDQKTVVGHDNFLMVGSHVAHNCRVGNQVTFANGTGLGGYVVVEDRVVIGGFAIIIQWMRIGTMAMVGVLSKGVKDIPPYVMADGNPLRVVGLNTVGLERGGVSHTSQQALKEAYKIYYRSKLLSEEALQKIEGEVPPCPEVSRFVEFIRAPSKSGVYRG